MKEKKEDKETIEVRLKLDKYEWERIKIIASNEYRSASAQVRVAIRSHINEWESFEEEG